MSGGRAVKRIAEAFSGVRIDQKKVLAELVAIREQLEASNRANLNPKVRQWGVPVSAETLRRIAADGEWMPPDHMENPGPCDCKMCWPNGKE